MIDDNQRELEERIRKNAVDTLKQLGIAFDGAQAALADLTKLAARKYDERVQQEEVPENKAKAPALSLRAALLMRAEEELADLKSSTGGFLVKYAKTLEYKGW